MHYSLNDILEPLFPISVLVGFVIIVYVLANDWWDGERNDYDGKNKNNKNNEKN
jgi:hypothetical protein